MSLADWVTTLELSLGSGFLVGAVIAFSNSWRV